MQNIDPSLYAVIDLGSSSFHMLIAQKSNGIIRPVDKIKRKVSLASGLDENNQLSQEAMQRGWDCLLEFQPKLKNIATDQIKIVATATLRQAQNSATFIERGNEILGHPIHLISGEEEARLIYQGATYTSGTLRRMLVVDIGGASTELIIGESMKPLMLNSLPMGCVTGLNRFFADQQLNHSNFDNAITHAKQLLQPLVKPYLNLGWDFAIGASGVMQAIHSILQARKHDMEVTLMTLYQLREQVISFKQIDKIEIDGLLPERTALFASGLAILIAIFERMNVISMTLAGGAIREGLIYDVAKPHSLGTYLTEKNAVLV